jgi:hypothetical protein
MPPPRLVLLFIPILSSVAHRRINSSHFNSRNYLFRDIYFKKMRRNATIAAPTAAAAATATAATTAAAVVSFRLYDYFLCNVTGNPIPAVAAGTS